MPYPNNSTVALSILGNTINVAVAEWEVNVVATFPATDIVLPAGRWLVTPSLQSTPEALAAKAQGAQQDVTYGGGGGTVHIPAFTYRAYRNIDGIAQALLAGLTIQRWNGGWSQYAAIADSSFVIRATDAYNPAALPKYGSALFVAGAGFDNVTSAQLHTMIDGAADMGMTLMRVGAPWSLCQPASAVFDATVTPRVDDVLAYCQTKGIQVVLEVGTCPAWATGYVTTASAPTDQTQYKAWIAAALGRWSAYLYGIGLANEPNGGTYYTGTVAQLVNLHTWAMAQKAITAAGVKVFGGNLAFGDVGYLTSMYAAGFKGKYDVLSIHPYNFSVSPLKYALDPAIPQAEGQAPDPNGITGPGYSFAGACEIIRELQITNTDLKPIAVTEFGYLGDARSAAWPSTEAQQASYLETAVRQAARIPYLDSLLIFKLADPPPMTGGAFGLIRANGVHKPAYDAVKAEIAELVAGTG